MSTFISSNQNREGYKGQIHSREMIQSCSCTPESGKEREGDSVLTCLQPDNARTVTGRVSPSEQLQKVLPAGEYQAGISSSIFITS